MSQPDLTHIVSLYEEIISEETVGSRFEGNDISQIWKLGDKINNLQPPLPLKDLLESLRRIHHLRHLRYDDRLYRAAVIFRRYWDSEEEFLKAAEILDAWTKLRELYPICDLILSGKSSYSRDDVNKLIEKCRDLTYLDTREVFKRFRKRDDYLMRDLGVDKYEVLDNLEELIEILHEIMLEEDETSMSEIRYRFDESNQRLFRMALSAIQQENVYTKFHKDIKKLKRLNLEGDGESIPDKISLLFKDIGTVIENKKARGILRRTIPSTDLGTLSTYLRAIASSENLEEYRKKQKLLEKFIGHMSGK